MAVKSGEIGIYGVLVNDTPEGVISYARQIKDERLNKDQQTINQELNDSLSDKVDQATLDNLSKELNQKIDSKESGTTYKQGEGIRINKDTISTSFNMRYSDNKISVYDSSYNSPIAEVEVPIANTNTYGVVKTSTSLSNSSTTVPTTDAVYSSINILKDEITTANDNASQALETANLVQNAATNALSKANEAIEEAGKAIKDVKVNGTTIVKDNIANISIITPTIDTNMSSTSTNAVQNKVIYSELNNIKEQISEIQSAGGGELNVINSIATPDGDLTPTSKKVTIPAAGDATYGVITKEEIKSIAQNSVDVNLTTDTGLKIQDNKLKFNLSCTYISSGLSGTMIFKDKDTEKTAFSMPIASASTINAGVVMLVDEKSATRESYQTAYTSEYVKKQLEAINSRIDNISPSEGVSYTEGKGINISDNEISVDLKLSNSASKTGYMLSLSELGGTSITSVVMNTATTDHLGVTLLSDEVNDSTDTAVTPAAVKQAINKINILTDVNMVSDLGGSAKTIVENGIATIPLASVSSAGVTRLSSQIIPTTSFPVTGSVIYNFVQDQLNDFIKIPDMRISWIDMYKDSSSSTYKTHMYNLVETLKSNKFVYLQEGNIYAPVLSSGFSGTSGWFIYCFNEIFHKVNITNVNSESLIQWTLDKKNIFE